jgi:hypothetical protein
MNVVALGVLLVVPQLFAAAPPPEDRTIDGDFRFRNRSKEKLWVEDATGLGVCGVLSPGISAGAHGFPFRLPAEVSSSGRSRARKGGGPRP